MPHLSAPDHAPARVQANPDLLADWPALMGLARLMRMAFSGQELTTLSQALIARAQSDEQDGNALMDLSTVLQLQGLKDMGLEVLGQALQAQRVFELPSVLPARVRLLAVMVAGDLMANAPLPFLFEDGDVALTMVYLVPGEPLPTTWPAHDLVWIALSEAQAHQGLLAALAQVAWQRPLVNRPARISMCARDTAGTLLQGLPGLQMPTTAALPRAALQSLADGFIALPDLLPGLRPAGGWPLIVRPLDSHAGHGLEKIDAAPALADYLARNPADARTDPADLFYVSRFVDYRSADGLFRKYRVVLVDGVACAGHMGVSEHWMIHYLNAGMNDSAAKRAEEEAFMRDFQISFAVRHANALAALSQAMGLDYLVIDCAETSDGELLVFEVDPGAVVHAMDPVELFPYKRAPMQRVFDAVRALLARRLAGA